MGFDAAGIELSNLTKGLGPEPEQRFAQIPNHIKIFCQAKLPRLMQLGVVCV